jgi:hypothetical protein
LKGTCDDQGLTEASHGKLRGHPRLSLKKTVIAAQHVMSNYSVTLTGVLRAFP